MPEYRLRGCRNPMWNSAFRIDRMREWLAVSVSPFVLAMALSAAGSFLGVLVASGIYLFGDEARERLVTWLVSYAVGTLLGLSLLHLVPQALESLPADRALGTLLLGIL